MVEGEDWHPLESKRKAITALLPYALQKERDGQNEMFDAFMRVIRASEDRDFMWRFVRQYITRMPRETSPRAIVLVLPHIRWDWPIAKEELIRQWAAAVVAVPYTEEIAQSVVNTLLQIASQEELISHIPADAWSWLAKRPLLPPICRGRDVGTRAHVVRAVRALKDIEALKSYFLLVWSEWNYLSSSRFMDTTHALPFPLTYRPRSTPSLPLSNDSDRRSFRGATTYPRFQKDAEIRTLDSVSRSHTPKGLGSIPNRRPSSRTPSPNSSYISSRTPSPHPPYVITRTPSPRPSAPSRTQSPHPSVPTRTPSPRPSVPTRTLSPHSFVPTRTPSPPSCIFTRTPSPRSSYYPPTRTSSPYPHNFSDRTLNSLAISISYGFDEMRNSIQEDFGGIEMGRHRVDLIVRLSHVLERLNRGLGYLRQHNPWLNERHLREMKNTYRVLRATLLRVDAEAWALEKAEAEVIGRITESHTTFMCALPLPCP